MTPIARRLDHPVVGPHESGAKRLVYGYLFGGAGICVLISVAIAIWGLPALALRIALVVLLVALLGGFALVVWRMRLCRARDLVESWIWRIQGESERDREVAANQLERFIEEAKIGRAREKALMILERARNEERQPGIRALMTSILDKFD